METYYAVAQIGAVCVPINYRLSPGEILFILKDSQSKVLVADPDFSEAVDAIRGAMDEIGRSSGRGMRLPEGRRGT